MPIGSPTVVTLDPVTDDRVRRLASTRQLSAESLVREAIEQYVSREETRQQAVTAWDEYQATGLHATAEETDAWLAKLEDGEDAVPPACHV
ncbi:CopG family ribbon-helix-helix protein [Bosea vaviloviae]|uniref:CopG family transcriptional regulator n=1 Tax=Bosea vaviloviae TaxID=1526658 RepID=A0A0N1N1Y9_9HYPH|nr:CopG family transcriptional regulator [Bosea vaviloviae]KPH77522.1 CopG family transcriptional regulator [Bosea vaviloviae]